MNRIGSMMLALILICAAMAVAAENSPTPIGKKVEGFSLPNIYGKTVSLDDYKDKVVVLAFLGIECPLARNYAPRLRDLAAEFESKGVVILGVDSNLQDSLTELAGFGKQNNLTFPLLKDNNNELADKVGAVRTPEVFVLDKERVIRYWGRIDDQYGLKTGGGYARPNLNERNLADALNEVLAGKQVSRPVVKADGCFIGRVTKTEPKGDVTYSKHVAKILQDRCVECHRPGEVAPFSLTSFDEVIGWTETIREVVQEGRMPPWFADPKHGTFANDARLTPSEKETLNAWLDNGCPQGDVKDLPPMRQFAEGWRFGTPDEFFYMADKPYVVKAEGTLPYQNFTIDPGWTTDKWIVASEARPSNRSVVHHIAVTAGKGIGLAAGNFIATYGPGTLPMVCEPGTAMLVPAGSKITMQMHYTPNGVEQEDRSMIGFKFADPATIKQFRRGGLFLDFALRIPAGASDYVSKASQVLQKDTVLLDLTPHMHLRGKSFLIEAQYPDGTQEVLLNVPNYDFNWQLSYKFAQPKLLPKGTKLMGTAHFDNSADNPANPDPKRNVTFGEQTWDEMMVGGYSALDPHENLLANEKK